MSAIWSQNQTLLFLETLQSESIIWDFGEKYHKDKTKIHDAWLRIQEVFNLPIEELKKKKDSLIATYRGYARKKEASMKSGAGLEDAYNPVWFAYECMDSFLGSVYKCRRTKNTHQNITACASQPTSNLTQKSMNRRYRPRKLRSKQKSEAFENLKKVIKTNAVNDDECNVFGKLIAEKLKKVPEIERHDLMFEIHSLFQQRHGVIRPHFTISDLVENIQVISEKKLQRVNVKHEAF